jgi:hypothetical protein
MTRCPGLVLLLLSLAVSGCSPAGDRDDDDVNDDDDSTLGDDDDSGEGDDDDSGTGDDDDSAAPCGLETSLANIGTWSRVLACGSATFSAATESDQVRLGIQMSLPPMNPSDIPIGAAYSLRFDAVDSKDEVQGGLVLEQGSDLSTSICSGIPGDPQVDWSWNPEGGSVTLTITGASDGGFFATIETVAVIVQQEEPSMERCALPDTVWNDVRLGWLPP